VWLHRDATRPLQRSPDAGCPLGYLISAAYKAPGRVPLSVRKVVPTLTSNEGWDLPLDGSVLATKDTGFILVSAGAVHPAVVCSGHCIASHRGARRGVATSEVGEKAWPPSPRGIDWGRCQYRGEGVERESDRCLSSCVPSAGGQPLLL
jgi:hypothetical protein